MGQELTVKGFGEFIIALEKSEGVYQVYIGTDPARPYWNTIDNGKDPTEEWFKYVTYATYKAGNLRIKPEAKQVNLTRDDITHSTVFRNKLTAAAPTCIPTEITDVGIGTIMYGVLRGLSWKELAERYKMQQDDTWQSCYKIVGGE